MCLYTAGILFTKKTNNYCGFRLESKTNTPLETLKLEIICFVEYNILLRYIFRCSLTLKSETNCALTKEEQYTDIDAETSLPKPMCEFIVQAPKKPMPSLMSHFELSNVRGDHFFICIFFHPNAFRDI